MEQRQQSKLVQVKGKEFPDSSESYSRISLEPPPFIIVPEALSNKYRKGLPYELLFENDLILMAESEELQREKIGRWRKGLKVGVA